MNKHDLILSIGKKRKSLGMSWDECASEYYSKTGDRISGNAMRKRFRRLVRPSQQNVPFVQPSRAEYEEHTEKGVELSDKRIFFASNEKKDPDTILRKLGYDPSEWTLSRWRIGRWDAQTPDGFDECYTVRASITPKKPEDLTIDDYALAAMSAFSTVTPLIPKKNRFLGNPNSSNRLLEIPPIELHYGKVASDSVSHERYDLDIADKRFLEILDNILAYQDAEQINRCLIVVGGDFFNSESNGMTSSGKHFVENCGDPRTVFVRGTALYERMLCELSEAFERIDVMYCGGNHARFMEFCMYMCLKNRFYNFDNIRFSDNLRDTQAYVFGKCALFFNHGDQNLKRTMMSIPAEFSEIWGNSKFRELHMGHLHCEQVVDEDMGMVARRVGAPCATDGWHYLNRFLGAVQKHQTFTWNGDTGLEAINYINVGLDENIN